eukprot:CAMPEP_0167778942 /NCGR_PEP_ID=MMETSP0111_2-20121227/4536_1 /TAXON_ID=91324 /ORGANISM="Lotharella globosa, Strain CCCM811" /LENGTH=262 /DNA_ID=CAMNT_0007669307 /DNA_START=101 /DNA_END=889 /DNA_ORIENTATION=+
MKTQRVIKELADSDDLSSVVIEMCPKRWGSMEKSQPRGSPRRKLLDNEMQAAADLAKDNKVEIILGDRCIATILDRAGSMFKKTGRDLLSPIDGWPAIARDFGTFLKSKSSTATPKIGLLDFTDPLLIMGLPVSLMRYPLALFLKMPLRLLGLLGTLELLSTDVVVSGDPGSMNKFAAISAVLLFGQFLFTIALARTIIVVMLMERDEVLADAIRDACRKMDRDQEVVAVLGIAHCNGVARLLAEQPTTDSTSSTRSSNAKA